MSTSPSGTPSATSSAAPAPSAAHSAAPSAAHSAAPSAAHSAAPSIDKVDVELLLGPDGLPVGGTSITRMPVPPAQVYALLRAFERYPGRVPMIHRAERRGSRVEIELRFKIALFSTKFAFAAEITEETDRFMELRGVSGDPRELRIRHDLEPIEDGAATRLRTFIGFDIYSVGWLVKLFLRHHPEIQFGVFAGTASALQHSLKRALGNSRLAGLT